MDDSALRLALEALLDEPTLKSAHRASIEHGLADLRALRQHPDERDYLCYLIEHYGQPDTRTWVMRRGCWSSHVSVLWTLYPIHVVSRFILQRPSGSYGKTIGSAADGISATVCPRMGSGLVVS
ncbi:hypothetical protein [Herpetosiphon giganteus]|uniref:hypothetical protein n=1 Tax=Herpetosiphon giganteus TaxID=2029754 RepID=UPI0019583893|nr:hypothetical protein [Herpetosiphon giganteus]MBM7845723.1 hypothetical protein [Herpetosiphon giganteus]